MSIEYSNTGSRNIADAGGPVITHAHVDLVFWGAGWNANPTLRATMQADVDAIMASPYLSGLSQYRGIGNGVRVRSDLITSTSPPSTFTDAQIDAMLKANMSSGALPNPSSDSQLLYMVVPQPGSGTGTNVGGEHGSDFFGSTRFHYGWEVDFSNIDDLTDIFSHELTEAVTDAEVNYRTAFYIPSTNDEVCDGEAQNYSYRLNNVLVQSSLSQATHTYNVYTGQVQNFFVSSGRVLTVNGDQLANHNDNITLDVSGGGVRVTLNGEVAQFDPSAISSVIVNTGDGTDTVNVLRTAAGVPLTINYQGGGGNDVANLGNAGSVQGIAGPVTIFNGPSYTTVNIDDSADTGNRNVTIGAGGVTGLAPAAINFSSFSVNTLSVLGGSGNNTYIATGSPALISTTIAGGGGIDTLIGSNAGNTWSLAGADAGSLSGAAYGSSVIFSQVGNLMAGSGGDTFLFADGATLSGSIVGGIGDTLNYSAYSTSVVADLQTGQATGVAGGVSGNLNVIGGTGGAAGTFNLMIGNGGATLTGGTGRRNLLVAGTSAATLIGGDNDDLLIAGSTVYDTEAGLVSWLQIAAEWAGSDDYPTRLFVLTNGIGVPLLDPTTVTGNGGGNTLVGAGELGLIYGDGLDVVIAFDPGSQTIPIVP